MELKNVIEDRRSIRKYKEEKIDENTIIEAIKYATMSPSAHNRQPWLFKIVSEEEKNKIADALYNKTKDIEGHTGPHTAGIIKDVPNLVVIFIDNDIKENRDMDVLSIGSAIENMLLYLTDLGLGSLWIANTNNIKEEIKEILNTEYETISCVAIGLKDQEPHARPRKNIEDVII